MRKSQLAFGVLLVLVGIFAILSNNVSAQSPEQFITSTTSSTISSVTSLVTSLSSTVITQISSSTYTVLGTSSTTETELIPIATVTNAYFVTSTSVQQIVSQLVSVNSNSVVTVYNDPTLLYVTLGVFALLAFVLPLIIWVYKQPSRPLTQQTVRYVQPQIAQQQYAPLPAPQPEQSMQRIWNGALYRYNQFTGQWDLVRR